MNHTSPLLSYLGQALGVPLGAIPLSDCRIQKPYLLKKHSISEDGTTILMAVPYLVTADAFDQRRNLSLYAVSKDYHGYFDALGKDILPRLAALYPDAHFALFADHSPIAEADAAARCGLGALGRHGLLITPAYGSFVFLGEIVTDMPYEAVTGHPAPQIPQEPQRCHGCGTCIRACPGKCLPESRDTCLSALTQKKGILTDAEVGLLKEHDLIWGCDTCQLTCPLNQAVLREGRDTPIRYFLEDRVLSLDAEALEQMPREIFDTYAFAWRGKDVLLRNIKHWGKEDAHDTTAAGPHGER